MFVCDWVSVGCVCLELAGSSLSVLADMSKILKQPFRIGCKSHYIPRNNFSKCLRVESFWDLNAHLLFWTVMGVIHPLILILIPSILPNWADVTYCTTTITCQQSTRQTNSQTPYLHSIPAHTLLLNVCLEFIFRLVTSAFLYATFMAQSIWPFFWMTTTMCKQLCPESAITWVVCLLVWFVHWQRDGLE